MNAVLRADNAARREQGDRDLSLAWHTAALQRTKRMPRLKALFSKRGRRKRPAVISPEMTPERRARIDRLAVGLTLSKKDPYE